MRQRLRGSGGEEPADAVRLDAAASQFIDDMEDKAEVPDRCDCTDSSVKESMAARKNEQMQKMAGNETFKCKGAPVYIVRGCLPSTLEF